MKIINTYFGNLIMVNNIVSINWRPIRDEDKHKLIYGDEVDEVVTVIDTNGKETIIGEYAGAGSAQDMVCSILEWLVDSEDDKQFDMPHYDDDRAPKKIR